MVNVDLVFLIADRLLLCVGIRYWIVQLHLSIFQIQALVGNLCSSKACAESSHLEAIKTFVS